MSLDVNYMTQSVWNLQLLEKNVNRDMWENLLSGTGTCGNRELWEEVSMGRGT